MAGPTDPGDEEGLGVVGMVHLKRDFRSADLAGGRRLFAPDLSRLASRLLALLTFFIGEANPAT